MPPVRSGAPFSLLAQVPEQVRSQRLFAGLHHSKATTTQIEHLPASGVACGDSATRVTEGLKALPGIGNAEVALSTGKVDVSDNERLTRPYWAITAAHGVPEGRTRTCSRWANACEMLVCTSTRPVQADA